MRFLELLNGLVGLSRRQPLRCLSNSKASKNDLAASHHILLRCKPPGVTRLAMLIVMLRTKRGTDASSSISIVSGDEA